MAKEDSVDHLRFATSCFVPPFGFNCKQTHCLVTMTAYEFRQLTDCVATGEKPSQQVLLQ
jgi:hypothetical protein